MKSSFKSLKNLQNPSQKPKLPDGEAEQLFTRSYTKRALNEAKLGQNLMHRAFLLALKPANDACFMELAKAQQARQLVSNLVLLHADRALLWHPILANTVFLRRLEMNHLAATGRRGRRTVC